MDLSNETLLPVTNPSGTVGGKTTMGAVAQHVINKIPSKEKDYDPSHHSGLGRKTLQLNNESNILTQSDFADDHTIYVIEYDFDLNGTQISIPEGCVLDFEGGSLDNGTIVLEDTDIVADRYQIFGDGLDIVCFARELNDESHFNPAKKRTLYTSWFGMGGSGDNVDKFVKAVSALKNTGRLIVDSHIHIEKPVRIDNLYYTTIEGEVGNDSINTLCYELFSNYADGPATPLFLIRSEGLQLKHLRFRWDRPGQLDYDTSGAYLICLQPNGLLDEVDCVLEECAFLSDFVGEPLNIQGRGVYIHNSLIHHTAWVSTRMLYMIRLIGTHNGNHGNGHEPKDSMRGISIKNNRFHVSSNNYMVFFEQDPNNPDTTFVNPVIEGNIADLGCAGIRSTARIRGLLVNGNTFNVHSHGTTHYHFNLIENSINGFSFVGNTLSSFEDPTTENENNPLENTGETWFVYKDGSTVFENINISGNTYDIQNTSCLVRFDGREYGKVESTYPVAKQLVVSDNSCSSRCFNGTSANTKALALFVNCGYNGIQVTGNAVENRNSQLRVNSITHSFVENDEYPIRPGEFKNAILLFNPGVSYDIWDRPEKTNHVRENIITTNSVRQRPVVSVGGRDSTDMYLGMSVFDCTINKPLWWDDHKWADINGFNGALSKGTTAQRPTSILTPSDIGFRYFDNELNKVLVYKAVTGAWIVDTNVVVGTPTKVANPCLEGNLYLLSFTQPNNPHSFYFCNEDESDKLVILDNQRQQQHSFVAPDPVRYPYIVFTVLYRDTDVKIINEFAWWEEVDGAKAGVVRTGTFAQAPAASDIYTGFVYMLVDGSTNLPLYAKVNNNNVSWYKADGTQYTGS